MIVVPNNHQYISSLQFVFSILNGPTDVLIVLHRIFIRPTNNHRILCTIFIIGIAKAVFQLFTSHLKNILELTRGELDIKLLLA